MSKERNSESPVTVAEEPAPSEDFIRAIIRADIESGKHSTVRTRFPPEPNGYLHIGHAKALCLDFGAAEEFGGECNLRFDDTNPLKEDVEYVDAIKEDVRWLGFDWGCREYYASDYFERLYQFAVQLIKDGKAYVDSLSAEEIRQYRGRWTEAGSRARTATARSRRASISSPACAPVSSTRASTCCAPRSTWRRAT